MRGPRRREHKEKFLENPTLTVAAAQVPATEGLRCAHRLGRRRIDADAEGGVGLFCIFQTRFPHSSKSSTLQIGGKARFAFAKQPFSGV